MPGRGRPWKGVGEGNPDRIGTGAIADGSITEADLDSSVTSKLNSASGHEILDEGGSLPARGRLDFVGAGVVASDGIEDTTTVTIAGGGAMTKLGETVLGSAGSSIAVTFNTAQSPGTYAEILIVADFDLTGGADEVDLRLDGVSGFTIQYSGWSVDNVPTLSALESNQADLIGSQIAFGEFNVSCMRVSIQTSPTGQYAGFVDERSGSGTNASSRGGWRTDTNDAGDLTGVTLLAKLQTFSIGSKVKAYVIS